MANDTCLHGLVQRNKFGTDERDGLEVCRGCGLPTSESLAKTYAVSLARDTTHVAAEDPILSSLRKIEAEAQLQNQRLSVIMAGVLVLSAIAVLYFVLGFLSWVASS